MHGGSWPRSLAVSLTALVGGLTPARSRPGPRLLTTTPGLRIPAGAQAQVHLRVQISPSLPQMVTTIVDDRVVVRSSDGVDNRQPARDGDRSGPRCHGDPVQRTAGFSTP